MKKIRNIGASLIRIFQNSDVRNFFIFSILFFIIFAAIIKSNENENDNYIYFNFTPEEVPTPYFTTIHFNIESDKDVYAFGDTITLNITLSKNIQYFKDNQKIDIFEYLKFDFDENLDSIIYFKEKMFDDKNFQFKYLINGIQIKFLANKTGNYILSLNSDVLKYSDGLKEIIEETSLNSYTTYEELIINSSSNELNLMIEP